MKKILSASQFRLADAHYIEQSTHTSLELMENAARAFCGCFSSLVPGCDTGIMVLCGTGNNGGDGLAIARLLQQSGYQNIKILVFQLSNAPSPNFVKNMERLKPLPVERSFLNMRDELPSIEEPVMIDALVGGGLNRPVESFLKKHIDTINYMRKYVVAVDIPSGLPEDGKDIQDVTVLKADDVISFQRPKLVFFFPESFAHMQRFHVVPIGLYERYMEQLPSEIYCLEKEDIQSIYCVRKKFSHKGSFGHALIIAGGKGKVGAGLLCAEASLYSGSGLTTISLEEAAQNNVYTRLPEVMVMCLEEAAQNLAMFSAIAIGPGTGDDIGRVIGLIPMATLPMVLDADALNYLSTHKELLFSLGERTILTPHVKEFDRLFGTSKNWSQRVAKAQQMSKKYKVIIILKNQYTFLAFPDGRICINTTGNPAMSTGGMGDVLTGMIVSFLAQGYKPEDAAILAVFLHGRAGDELHRKGMDVIPATRLIHSLPFILSEIK